MALAQVTWPLTVDSSNQTFKYKENVITPVDRTATITAGTYWAPKELASELETQMNALGGYTYTLTVSEGVISFSAGVTSSFGFYSYVDGNTAAYITGYGDTATGWRSNAGVYTMPHQTWNAFCFGSDGPDLADDTEDRGEVQAPAQVSLSGTVARRPLGSIVYTREIKISFVPRDKMFKDSDGNKKQSIEDLFEYVNSGSNLYVRYYPDQSDTASYIEYVIMPSGEKDSLAGWDRIDPAVELWGGRLRLRKKV